jgi:hypothetical protein
VEHALAAASKANPAFPWKDFDVFDPQDYDGDRVHNEPDGYVDHFVLVYAGTMPGVTPPVVRRPGGLLLHQITAIVPGVVSVSDVTVEGRTQIAPGQLLRHYAPTARMTLYLGEVEAVAVRVAADVRSAVASGLRVGVIAPEEDLMELAPRLAAVAAGGRVVTRRCGSRADREEAARDLFRVLRELDAEGLDVIYATALAGGGIEAAIVDRLTRASEGRVVAVGDDIE